MKRRKLSRTRGKGKFSLIVPKSPPVSSEIICRPRVDDIFSYMLDMHLPPDQVELSTALSGSRGSERDAQNIRCYFQRAISVAKTE